MDDLKTKGTFEVSKEILEKMTEVIYAGMSTEDDTKRTIAMFFDEYAYPLDPHTAVGVYVSDNYSVEENDLSPMVALSTASPYKFTESVITALGKKTSGDSFKDAKTLQKLSAEDIPEAISKLKEEDVRFKDVFEVSEMRKAILNFIANA